MRATKHNSPYSAAVTGCGFMLDETVTLTPILALPDADSRLQSEIEGERSSLLGKLKTRLRMIAEFKRRYNAMPPSFWTWFLSLDRNGQSVALYYCLMRTYLIVKDLYLNLMLPCMKSGNPVIVKADEERHIRKPAADLEDKLKSLTQYYKDCAIALAWVMKKDWHKAESAAKNITQQTAADAVGASDSRISDHLNKKYYEDNPWAKAAWFWQDQCADLQQLSIFADIIRTKLHRKMTTIDNMDAIALYTLIVPFLLEQSFLNDMCQGRSLRGASRTNATTFNTLTKNEGDSYED